MPFHYFGSKKRLAPTYPVARYDTIIEPFAGAAAYSLRGDHWTRNVILIDNDPNVIAVWKFLQSSAPSEIGMLPNVHAHRPYPVAKGTPAYSLMRWADASRPQANTNTVSARSADKWPTVRTLVAQAVDKIRHWQIIEGDYWDAPDVRATWFIDPPYQHQGHLYRNGSEQIDYQLLGDWCVDRTGQVIVCEQEPADWLPFEHHTSHITQSNKSVSELMWTNVPALRLF